MENKITTESILANSLYFLYCKYVLSYFFSFRDVNKTKYLICLNLRVLNHQSVDLIRQDTLVLSINYFVAFHFKAVRASKDRI
jgi:hypothetical protein